MDETRPRAIEEESAMLVEFIQTQRQAMDELVVYVQQAHARAQATVENTRRIRAGIAARRPRHRPTDCNGPIQ
jgi:hypothetical protein